MSTDQSFSAQFADGVVAISGDLDAHTAATLDHVVEQASQHGPLILDMSGVHFVDSSGLRALLKARSLGDAELEVTLRAPSSATLRLLEVTCLTEHFIIEAAN